MEPKTFVGEPEDSKHLTGHTIPKRLLASRAAASRRYQMTGGVLLLLPKPGNESSSFPLPEERAKASVHEPNYRWTHLEPGDAISSVHAKQTHTRILTQRHSN